MTSTVAPRVGDRRIKITRSDDGLLKYVIFVEVFEEIVDGYQEWGYDYKIPLISSRMRLAFTKWGALLAAKRMNKIHVSAYIVEEI